MTAVTAPKDQARDLEADLAICEAATPGDWKTWGSNGITHIAVADDSNRCIADIVVRMPDATFIEQARAGWPYAIRRAIEAENEVDKLRRELETLQDQMNRPRGCWD